jgi:hypothetical protein
MLAASTNINISDYAVWLITITLVAFGFKYATQVIAFVLEKLYQYFIQNNSFIIN